MPATRSSRHNSINNPKFREKFLEVQEALNREQPRNWPPVVLKEDPNATVDVVRRHMIEEKR